MRVLVVDDQPVVRSATRSLLDAAWDFDAVGEAASGLEALRAVDELAPDLVLLDVRMPGMDGIETAERIRAAHHDTLVVLMSSDEPTRDRGAAPFVAKALLKAATLRRLWAQHAPSR